MTHRVVLTGGKTAVASLVKNEMSAVRKAKDTMSAERDSRREEAQSRKHTVPGSQGRRDSMHSGLIVE